MDFTSFHLDERLQKAVREAGYTETTPIQAEAIPAGLAGEDLIGTAQTGTGKTAAFVLPILQLLLSAPAKKGRTRALIVTPTRELAEQNHQVIRELGRYTGIRSATVYGGVGMGPQESALRQGTEIVVACPGRLLDHLDRGHADLGGVEFLVLDEGDRMLDMGFLPQVRKIAQRVPRQRQTMLFSATFAPELAQLAGELLRHPRRIEVGTAAPPHTVDHVLYPVVQDQKTDLLLKLLTAQAATSVLVFTRTKHRANRVARQLERAGHLPAVLHSNRSQSQRQKALEGFRAGRFRILVATDIAARGLDIEAISHVINYDIPDTPDAYIHRIGRTGRMERSGDAITLVTPEDRGTVRDIERVLGQPIPVRRAEGFPVSAALPLPPRAPVVPRPPLVRAPVTHPAPRPQGTPGSGPATSGPAGTAGTRCRRRRRGGRGSRPAGAQGKLPVATKPRQAEPVRPPAKEKKVPLEPAGDSANEWWEDSSGTW